MKKNVFPATLVILSMVVLSAMPAVAADDKDPVAGDWRLTSDFNGQPITSLLLISKNKDGAYQGNWVSFWGINQIEDMKVDGEKITFSQTNRFRNQEFTLDFSGTIKEGKLTGNLMSDQWDSDYEGTRIKPVEPIVGVWEFRRQRGDREFVNILTVSSGNSGQLKISWEDGRTQKDDDDEDEADDEEDEGEKDDDDRDEWSISNVTYDAGKLTFTRTRTDDERTRESTYTLTAHGDTITGIRTSQRGKREIEGKRLGCDLIGKWNLTMTSDMGERQQLLWVLPDMSAMLGSTDVGKIMVEDGTISFDYEISFGDRTFENDFKGKLENGILTGEMTNARGVQQVKGQKMEIKKS